MYDQQETNKKFFSWSVLGPTGRLYIDQSFLMGSPETRRGAPIFFFFWMKIESTLKIKAFDIYSIA